MRPSSCSTSSLVARSPNRSHARSICSTAFRSSFSRTITLGRSRDPSRFSTLSRSWAAHQWIPSTWATSPTTCCGRIDGDAFDSLHGPASIRTGVPSPARLLRRPGGPTGGELDPNRQDRTRMNLVKSAWPRSRRRRHDTSVQARGSFGAPNPSSCREEPTRVTQLDDHSYPLEAPSFGEITFRGETQ